MRRFVCEKIIHVIERHRRQQLLPSRQPPQKNSGFVTVGFNGGWRQTLSQTHPLDEVIYKVAERECRGLRQVQPTMKTEPLLRGIGEAKRGGYSRPPSPMRAFVPGPRLASVLDLV